jgi:hypothetical protein
MISKPGISKFGLVKAITEMDKMGSQLDEDLLSGKRKKRTY